MERAYPFCTRDVVCFHTAPTFVDSLWQIFGPLLGGIPCLVLPPPASRDPAALLAALHHHSITHFVAVPTLLSALLCHLDLTGLKGALLTVSQNACYLSEIQMAPVSATLQEVPLLTC